ncbi:MAG: ioquinoline 1-oxidoreductase subunit [Labilithrix sp.]|nr:ioquinoline 1-oxidoreductase subunit [Labilithrix sp.]
MLRNTLRAISVTAALLAGCKDASTARAPLPPVAATELRAPEAFAAIPDREERSRALFLEASRVILHPRCANCHPSGDTPLQGMAMVAHDPPVTRGPEDQGVVGMECTGCHQDRNLEQARSPGAPKWHVAPRAMAWVGKSPHDICEQMKDRKRNGNRSLAQLVEHNAHDELVGWGWRPGHDREPAPGTQKQFGAIVAAWVETGAECPSQGARP